MKPAQIASVSAQAGFDEVFEGYVRTGTPVVLRGAALDWPCRKRWTPEFLKEHYGDVLVDYYDTHTQTRTQRPLGDYFELDSIEQSRWYIVDWDFRRGHPELLEDVLIPRHFDIDWIDSIPETQRPDLMWVYCGHAGTRGPTHVDNFGSSAWLAVLNGQKRVRFAASSGLSQATMRSLDLFALEVMNQMDLQEARLETGDVLFVPAGHWHAAVNDTYCLSLTANFVDGANFSNYRSFATQKWYGRRMLITQINRFQDLPTGSERYRLQRHLALALDRLSTDLFGELAELEEIAKVLKEAPLV